MPQRRDNAGAVCDSGMGNNGHVVFNTIFLRRGGGFLMHEDDA